MFTAGFDGFKFDYFIKSGCQKGGLYSVRETYRYKSEFLNLPDDLKIEFMKKEINAARIIDPLYHSLSIKNGKILAIDLVPDELFDVQKNQIQRTEIIYDLTSFLSRYATAIVTGDIYSLENNWYNQGVRITNIGGQPNVITGKNIIRRLINIQAESYTWVNFYFIKEIGNKFFSISDKENGFTEFITSNKLEEETFVIAEIPIIQHWINFSRFKKEISYVSIDTVDFTVSIFNFKRAQELLRNQSDFKHKPNDYFGMMLYLKHLFKEDNRLIHIKNKYKNNTTINKFLRLSYPEISTIPSFMSNTFNEKFLSSNQKRELLTFFLSADYEALHLEYDVFHQTFLQILSSKTRPIIFKSTFFVKNNLTLNTNTLLKDLEFKLDELINIDIRDEFSFIIDSSTT